MNSVRQIINKFPAAASRIRASSGKNMVQGNFVDVAGHKIHYLKVGNGEHNLLLIPGALGSSVTDFSSQIEKLNPNKFTIIAWDPPGYGRSRPPDRTYPLNFFHRDANAAVDFLKALNISKTSVIGWSDGGIVSLVLAAENPKLMEKLVVFGSNAYVDSKDIELYEAVRDIDKWSPRMKDPLIEMYGEDYFRNTWGAWIDAMTAIYRNGGDICRNQLRLISCPTLILHGMKDAMVPQFHPEYLKQNIKNNRYIEYDDGKHHLHMQYPERFNKDVEEFLTS